MKRFTCLLLIYLMSTTFFVAPVAAEESKSYPVPVIVNASSVELDVQIPTTFEVSVSESGAITGPTNTFAISNKSLIDIKISQVAYTPPITTAGWKLVSASQINQSIQSGKANIREFYAQLDKIGSKTVGKDLFSSLSEFKEHKITRNSKEVIQLSYTKKSPLQTVPSRSESGGIFTFVFDFYE